MEAIKMMDHKPMAPMDLREASIALLEQARRFEGASPTDAAYMAGYIARYIETADKQASSKGA